MMQLPKTRKEALALGLTRFFTGKPCKHGHTAEQFAKGACVECSKKSQAKYRSENAGVIAERAAKHHAENREVILRKQAKYRAENPEKRREQNAKWRAKNPMYRIRRLADDRTRALERDRNANYYAENREKVLKRQAKHRTVNRHKIRESEAKYRAKNLGTVRANEALKRARKRGAIPVDLTAEEKQRIEDWYTQRDLCIQLTGVKHHVDHIIPVSKGGLHHPNNMQIMTEHDNCSKNNRTT